MHYYVHIYTNKGTIQSITTEDPETPYPYTGLHTYVYDEETGNMSLYSRPEPLYLFSYWGGLGPDMPSEISLKHPLKAGQISWSAPNYWEIMPNGDFRKLTDEEKQANHAHL